MKLSVEAKVAAAVAAGLMVLTSGAMAQGRRGQAAGPNHYGPTNNPGVNTHMSQQGGNSSLFGRTNAEENKPTVSDEKVTSSGRERREEARDRREEARDRREEGRERREEEGRERRDRHQAHRQREERHQTENAKDKSPFDGSILEAKPADVSR